MNELTSSLNLVLCNKNSTGIEMEYLSVHNVGWAAEIVDNWNAVLSHQTAVQSHSSVPLSPDNTSSLLQCTVFCKSFSLLLSMLPLVL